MFGTQVAEVIRRDLIAMRDGGLFSIAELKANADIIGVDLLQCSEDQQTRARALRDSHQPTEAKADPQVSVKVGAVEDQPGEKPKPARYTTSVEELIKIDITRYTLTKVIGQQKRINQETGEPEPDPLTGEKMIPKIVLSPTQASAEITGWMGLRLSATDENEKESVIWRLDESGIWKPDGEKVVKQVIDAVCGDLSDARGLSETMRRIRAISETVVFDADHYLFPAQDCVIDLRTGQSRDYQIDGDDYVTFRYSAALHNPDADYHRLLWFLCTTYPDPRDVLTALDILAASVIRVAFDAIIQLIGPGGNGKRVFESRPPRFDNVIRSKEKVRSSCDSQ